MLTPTEAAYFAGILDGEGSIAIYPRWVRVAIGNTDENLIEWLRGFCGGVSANPSHPNRKQCWRWQIGNRVDCRWLLVQVLPYLIIKRARALEALAVLDKVMGEAAS